MEDTQPNKASESAATRKRRSSILKSQRPPRAPLSELEFNVATPTDASKSRRVSFSRRTGVAEFVTNEATTTWKNFYEEHNKTLESSGNDSEVKPPRSSVSCLGKRIFEQQFQEIEAVDYTCTFNDGRGVNASMNNVNFEIQNDPKNQNFELSEFTEQQSRLFSDDLAISGLGEVSDRINVNFSVMQPVDDLDEIQKDLVDHAKKNDKNVVCVGPSGGNNQSEYIEVDLNMTHVALNAEQSDMSITDTIHSPKVNVSKTNDPNQKSLDKDWVADKENILINPYVAPKESDNFAINEQSDKVLVFDGKRLTVQSENEPLSDYRKTLLPNTEEEKPPQRKTIVLNVDDDLPNFVDNPHVSISQHLGNVSMDNKTVLGNFGDLSMTQPLAAKLEANTTKRQTIVFDEAMNDISVTQALPTNILQERTEKRRTIVYDSEAADISVTQAVPSNLLITGKDEKSVSHEKRKTIVFEDDEGNISITQALANNVILNENGEIIPVKRKTIVFETDAGNISVTQVVPSTIIRTDRSESIVFSEKTGNISVTQAVSSNLILTGKHTSHDTLSIQDSRKTLQKTESLIERVVREEYKLVEKSIIYDQEAEISVTQAVPSNIILSQQRKSTVYDVGDISMTQAVPSNLILAEQVVDKSKTVIYDDDTADISMTQAIPNLILPEKNMDIDSEQPTNIIERFIDKEPVSEKRKTIIYEDGDISMTLPVPRGAIIIDNDSNSDRSKSIKGETSATSSGSTVLQELARVDSNEADVSVTGSDDVMETEVKRTPLCKENVKVCVSESDSPSSSDNLVHRHRRTSIKPIPQDIMALEKELLSMSNYKIATLETSHMQDVICYQTSTKSAPIKTNESIRRTEQKEFLTDVSSSSAMAGGTDSDRKPSLVDVSATKVTDNESTATFIDKNSKDKPSQKTESADPKQVKSGPHSQSDIGYGLIESASAVSEIRSNIQKSILNDLLDMREESDCDGIEDKSITAKIPSETSEKPEDPQKANPDNSDTDSLFFIMKDSTDETEKSDDDKSIIMKNPKNHSLDVVKKTVHIEDLSQFKNCIEDIGKKLISIETGSPPNNRHFERVFSTDVDSNTSRRKSYKDVDSTKDILDMLSQFTDKEEEDDPIEPIKKKDSAVEEKLDKSRRLSSIPRRQSVVLSREDMLNNISMAQAVLQKSHVAHSDSETDRTPSPDKISSPTKSPRSLPYKNQRSPPNKSLRSSPNKSPTSSSLKSPRSSPTKTSRSSPKSPRSSPEVVKTLRFEDDESDMSTKFELGLTTPLKKTAFGETSYMINERKRNDSKPNVIPTYLKDVSDGIKALMSELVKPMADVMPFETGLDKDYALKRNASTCSTQIQANLVTSSQVDLDPEPHSNPESLMTLSGVQKKLKGIMKPYSGNQSVSEPGTTSERSFEVDWKISSDQPSYDLAAEEPPAQYYAHDTERPVESSVPGRVIVFDPRNPLNNVLLAPIDMQQAHRYEPSRLESLGSPKDIDSKPGCPIQVSFRDEGAEANERVNYNYNVPSIIPNFVTQNDACVKKTSEENSYGRPMSVDHSVETLNEMKDQEINTLIAMKDNRKLLEESSSLTLVDESRCEDAPCFGELDSGTSKNGSPCPTVTTSRSSSTSPVEVIYTQSGKLDSDVYSEDEVKKVLDNTKKRKHEKHKFCQLSALDVTPKPIAKVSKLSNSPPSWRRLSSERTNDRKPSTGRLESETKSFKAKEKAPKKRPSQEPIKPRRLKEKSPHRSPKHKKPGTTITVQRLMAEYHMTDVDKNTQILDAMSREAEVVESVSSDKKVDVLREDSGDSGELKEKALPMEWQTNLTQELGSRSCSLPDKESEIDVVEKIDMLPFMGGECEWESSSSSGWSFRLLHCRLRLAVRLRHAGAAPAAAWRAVRADVPVAQVLLDALPHEKKNPIAELCVRFAAEAMRYFIARGCATAADVPALLRRCAGVARVALRWGRAMHDAWTHLAYTLTADGVLTLKVANIPLRSVWEVTLQISMIVSDAREVPWPCASELRVTSVVSDVSVTPAELRRAAGKVRRDWGHVPRTLWRVFKYLKNKTRDDDLVLGM